MYGSTFPPSTKFVCKDDSFQSYLEKTEAGRAEVLGEWQVASHPAAQSHSGV